MYGTSHSDGRPLRWGLVETIVRFVLVLGVLTTVLAVGWGAHTAAAQQNNSTATVTATPTPTPTPGPNASDVAPMYDDASASDVEAEQDAWLAGIEEPTLPAMLDLLTRVGVVWIGVGGAQGGGPAGVLLTGLVVLGAVLSTATTARVGPVAGGALATATILVLGSLGLAPQWVIAVALFLLGAVAVGVLRRSF
jgi:hypothetical protein